MRFEQKSARITSGHAPLSLEFRSLTPDDVEQMMTLQEVVRQALPPQEESFIVIKEPGTFAQLVVKPNHAVGIFDTSGILCAHAMISVSSGQSLGGLTESPAARLLISKFSVFGVVQSILVDPAYRGLHLMRRMLEDIELNACRAGVEAVLAEIAAGNYRSEMGFRNHGYKFEGKANDPDDGTPLIFLSKSYQMGGSHLGGP